MCNSKLKSLESLDSSDIATLMSKMGFYFKVSTLVWRSIWQKNWFILKMRQLTQNELQAFLH